MRKILLVGIVGILVLGGGWWIAARVLRSPGSPTSQTYNFGTAREGEMIEHAFLIPNPSFRPLKITNIKTSCSCTTPKERPTEIAPRSVYEFVGRYDSKGQSGASSGKISVEFEGRDSVTFMLTGNVLAMHPHKLDFGRVRQGDYNERQFTIHALPGQDLAIVSMEYDQSFCDVSITSESTPKSKNIECRVRLNKNIRFGGFLKTIGFVTNDPIMPRKEVTMMGHVMNRFEAEPLQVAFGIIQPGTQCERKVKVFSPYGDPVSIEKIECPKMENFSWEFVPDSTDPGSGELRLRLKGIAGAQEKVLSTDIAVYGKAGSAINRIDLTLTAMFRGEAPQTAKHGQAN